MKKQSTYYTAGTSDASCHLVLTTTQRKPRYRFYYPQFTKGKVKAQKVRCSPQATDQEGKGLGRKTQVPLTPAPTIVPLKLFTYPPNSDAN